VTVEPGDGSDIGYSLGQGGVWALPLDEYGLGLYKPSGEADALSAHKTPAIRRWAKRENVELCFTPTSASWANSIEAHFGPLRTFVMGNSDYPNHTALTRRLQAYLRWRSAHAHHPDVLAAQRRERARIRSERQQCWDRPKPKAA
jgi:hypothetical protein